MDEILPLVDETGRVVGKASRADVHGNPRLLHPVVHLHIFDKQGRLLLQRRSLKKDLFPGFWDTAVGGHLSWGEDNFLALRRECQEELGINPTEASFCYSYILRNTYESEYVYTYVLESEGPFKINHEEVAEIRFFNLAELEAMKGKGLLTPNAEEELVRLELFIGGVNGDT